MFFSSKQIEAFFRLLFKKRIDVFKYSRDISARIDNRTTNVLLVHKNELIVITLSTLEIIFLLLIINILNSGNNADPEHSRTPGNDRDESKFSELFPLIR